MRPWTLHIDHQLYKALEHQYQLGLEALNENLPEIKVELLFRYISHYSLSYPHLSLCHYHLSHPPHHSLILMSSSLVNILSSFVFVSSLLSLYLPCLISSSLCLRPYPHLPMHHSHVCAYLILNWLAIMSLSNPYLSFFRPCP